MILQTHTLEHNEIYESTKKNVEILKVEMNLHHVPLARVKYPLNSPPNFFGEKTNYSIFKLCFFASLVCYLLSSIKTFSTHTKLKETKKTNGNLNETKTHAVVPHTTHNNVSHHFWKLHVYKTRNKQKKQKNINGDRRNTPTITIQNSRYIWIFIFDQKSIDFFK